MTTIQAHIRRHPVLTFYVVVFVISWGGFLIAVGPTTRMSVVEIPPVAILSMVVGPLVATILLTSLVHGKAGYRDLLSRLLRWRVGVRWYAPALLIAPLLVLTVTIVLSLLSPSYLPSFVRADDKLAFLLFNLWVALMAGIVEEIGWTGFAVPMLRTRFGVFASGLIAGVLWGAWHFLGNVAAAETVRGTIPLFVYLPMIFVDVLVGSLLPFRVLMVWVYDHTESLLVAILMHVSLTASIRILTPVGNEGMAIFIYDFTLAAAFWLVVAVVAAASRGHLTRQPLQGQVA